jgi:hypothetical protein
MSRRRLRSHEKHVLALSHPKGGGRKREYEWIWSDPRHRVVNIGRVGYSYDPKETWRTRKHQNAISEARWWRKHGFRARVITVNKRTGRVVRRSR